MPRLSSWFTQNIDRLIALPWYVKWFFPRKLRTALNTYTAHEEPTPQDAWDICNAFFDSWSFQRYVISLFYDFSSSYLGNLFNGLKDAGLLNAASGQDNWQKATTHIDPYRVAEALIKLHEAGLLSGASAQDNRQAVATHRDPESVAAALKILHEAGLLSDASAQDNRQAVATHRDPESVAKTLKRLHEAAGLLTGTSTQEIRQAVATHPYPEKVAQALTILHEAGLLSSVFAQVNRQAVITHQDLYWAVEALTILHKAGLLSGASAQDNWQAVITHSDPLHVAEALKILHKVGLLNSTSAQENWQAVITHSDPLHVADVLKILHKAGLLNSTSAQENWQAVATHQSPHRVAEALIKLHEAGLLSGTSAQENRQAVATHQDLYWAVEALTILHKAGLLSGASGQDNWQAVITHPDPWHVAYALQILYRAGLLTSERRQAHFNSLLTYSDILLADNTYDLWNRIPAHLMTQEVFNQIIQLAQQYQTNPQEARQRFLTLVNRDLLHIRAETGQVINTGQSTHTVSVHASVSQSAIKLLCRYGQAISKDTELNDILREMTTWINSLSTSEPKKAAAQRGFHRIVRSHYTDSVSQVSIQQLLAITWLAIQDKKHAQGSLENLKGLLIEGLYEIQRGYNLSETGDDDGGPDSYICIGGTFNKLMEKLSRQHPDVELIFMVIDQGPLV